jgi:hypothetical protein
MHANVRQRSRWAVALLAVVVLAVSIQYGFKAAGNRSAILRWREQLQELPTEDIYQRFVYPNPPIMAILLEPLAHLPPLAGSLTWFYLKAGMTVLTFWWLFQIVETPELPFPGWAKLLAVALSLRPIIGDLSHGNVNLFILFLVVAGLYAFHRRWDVGAGLLLALAIACKVTPVLFIPYFLWKRSWRVLSGVALGLVLFLILVPGSLLGMERNLRLLHSWTERMVMPFVVQGVVTSEHANQSLPGLVYRLTTHNPSFLDEEGKPAHYHNVLDLDPRWAAWFVKACMLAFAATVVWSCRTPTEPRRGWQLAGEFSLVVLGMLLFSERTWKHHCVTLVLPFTVLSYYVFAACRTVRSSKPSNDRPGRQGARLRVLVVCTILVVQLLMATTSTSLAETAKLAQVYGGYVWAYLLLIGVLVVLLSGEYNTGHDPVAIRCTDREGTEGS